MWGVEPSYVDARGEEREASDDALLAALRGLGAPVGEDPDDVEEAARVHRLRRWRRLSDPVRVAWEGDRPAVVIHVPLPAVDVAIDCRLELDGGDVEEWTTDSRWVETVDAADVDGERHLARRMLLPRDLDVPPGVHDLHLDLDGRRTTVRLLRAPRTVYGGDDGREDGGAALPSGRAHSRDWALFLPLYALRTGRCWGTADVTDLAELSRWVADRGGGGVATLPLLASFLEGPADPSPYAPVSRLFWNELYLDPASAPELESAPEARELLEDEDFLDDVASARAAARVDYGRAASLKRRALEALARKFFAGSPQSSSSWRAFLEDRPAVEAYARFRALTEARGAGWREWSDRPEPGELEAIDHPVDAARYHLFAQWLAYRQVPEAARAATEAGAPLHLDFPLGVHPDGFDPWRWPGLFVDGVAGGAPPDDFHAGGQDWGFPPLHPRALRRDGYGYLRRALARVLEPAGSLRLDHVMGLHRLYWVPEGMTPDSGVYVRYPAEELWALLCIETRRYGTRIVGEDLGTVPEEVREALAEHGAARSFVVPFEIGDGDDPGLSTPPARAVAALDTHDTPTWAGWWKGTDIERRRRAGLLDPGAAAEERERRAALREALVDDLRAREAFEAAGLDAPSEAADAGAGELLRAVLVVLGRSDAERVVVNAEDLWLEEEPQNVPEGGGGESWRRKAALALEEWDGTDDVVEILRLVDEARRDGRASGDDDGSGEEG